MNHFKTIIIVFFLALIHRQVSAQTTPVSVTINVLPPYSPYYSTYMDDPNKILITVMLSPGSADRDVYLHGSISGENGVNIFTASDYKPATPLHLQSGVPLQLTIDDIKAIFDINHIEYEGITAQDIISTGMLPEDYYRVCIQAFDYDTDEPVSAEAPENCSAEFLIENIEPPMIITPVCGEVIDEQINPSIYVSWTMPTVSDPSGIYYIFRVIEIPLEENTDPLGSSSPSRTLSIENGIDTVNTFSPTPRAQNRFYLESNIDPLDALTDPNYASIYETTVTGATSILITNDRLQLEGGNIYAFTVQAVSADLTVEFKNHGVSEGCWFQYNKQPLFSSTTTGIGDISVDDGNLSDYINDFELLPHTVISGKILYKLASEANISGGGSSTAVASGNPPPQPQQNDNGDYNAMIYGNLNLPNSNNNNNLALSLGSGISFASPSITNSNTNPSLSLLPPFGAGYMNDNTVNKAGALPLPNTLVRLVARFAYYNNGLFDTRVSINGVNNILDSYTFYDLHGNIISRDKIQNLQDKILDVEYTGDDGSFTFDFETDFFTGPVYGAAGGHSFGDSEFLGVMSLHLEVINQKFCSPDINIFAGSGGTIDLPTQVALIKDYSISIRVKSDYDEQTMGVDEDNCHNGIDKTPKRIPGGKPIPNAYVKVLRPMDQLKREHPAIISAEGQKLGSKIFYEGNEYKEVFSGIAGNDGKVTITGIVKHWEPVDGKNKSPYLYLVGTRALDPGHTSENMDYNFEPYFGDITGMPVNADWNDAPLDDDAGYNWGAAVTYNSFYAPPHSATKRGVMLKAANPEIKGRTLAQTNLENIGLKDIKVSLYMQNKYEKDPSTVFINGTENPDLRNVPKYEIYNTQKTNDAGFFRFKDLPVFYKNEPVEAVGPYWRLQIESDIYEPIIWKPLVQFPFNLAYGTLFHKDFQLYPKRKLKGVVVDETGKPVSAYLRLLENNPYVKTAPTWGYDSDGWPIVANENFEIAIKDSGNRFEVLPLSHQYFPETIELNQIPVDPNTPVTFTVHRKMHRLKLLVTNKITHKAIPKAFVIVGDLALGATNENGLAELVFASPGEQFTVKVITPGYTPAQTSFNIPVTKDWTFKTAALEPSFEISGIVTNKNTHRRIDRAEIYVNLSNANGQIVRLNAFTNKEGKYTLRGIPMEMTSVELHVVKDGKNPSYIGQVKTVHVEPFAYPKPSIDFQLESSILDLSEIWGFPVTIEGITAKQGHDVTISGYFHDLPNEDGFSTLNDDEKIYFKNVKIEPAPSDHKLHPLNNTITTSTYYMGVKLEGGIDGKMFVPTDWQYEEPLQVVKSGNKSMLTGALYVNLASFAFAYDFSGDFYIGTDTTKKDANIFSHILYNTNIPHFKKKYYVFDMTEGYTPVPYPIKNYRVFGFNASSSFSDAYYEDKKIYIGTTLHTDIPLGKGAPPMDLKIYAGAIKVSKDEIDLQPNPNNQITFDLEKWKVKSTHGWLFDKTKDAIIVPRCFVNTQGGADFTIKNLNIRTDALREGIIDLQEGLTLGGITKIKLAPGLTPVFNFDEGIGHYRISLSGESSGEAAAWVDNLPATHDRLEFTSIGILSDNSSVLSLGKSMTFHGILTMFIDQIMTGNGFFTLSGMPELGIPGLIPTTASMMYTKKNGHLVAEIMPINGAVDCNANVAYQLQQDKTAQKLVPDKYTAYGEFFIKPPAGESGEKVKLRGFLTKTPSGCHIDVLPQTFKMGKEEMRATQGKISVNGNTWGNLVWESKTRSQGLDDNNTLTYLVHGGIETSASGIKANSIDTPLGDLNMAYIFSEKALVGDLTIKKNLDMGFAKITSGMMKTRFDPAGFYLGLSCGLKIGNDIYDGGFLLGAYENNLNNFVAPILAKFETSRPDFSSLHGFYAIGQRTLIDKNFNLVGITIAAKAGIGAIVNFDYANPKFQIGGYGFAHVAGGIDVPACGFVGASADAYLDVKGTYEDNNLSVSSCGTMSTCVGACGLEGCLTVLEHLKVSTDSSKNDFTLKVGGSCSDYHD